MVQEIKGFKADDGTIFEDEYDAVTHDTRRRLIECVGDVVTVEIMNKVLGVHHILTPLVTLMEQRITGDANAQRTDHPAYSEGGAPGIYKGLHVGITGAGKTGCIAALLDAGYKVRALDFDRGLDPIIGYAKKRNLLGNLSYHTLTDEFKLRNGFMAIQKAPAFQEALKLLDNWDDLGPVQSWGADTILLIDTLGSMSKSSFNMVLQANGVARPSGERGGPEQSHYGAAQDNVERLLLNLTNPLLVPCHVIVNAHWTYQESQGGRVEPYPETIGKALNPTIGRKFNNLLSFSISAGERKINVKKDGVIPCKTSKPMKQDTYPIDTGMATIFREIVGPPPAA